MTVSGRKQTIAKGSNRPNSAIQGRSRERRLWDHKADIANKEIIVRRSSR